MMPDIANYSWLDVVHGGTFIFILLVLLVSAKIYLVFNRHWAIKKMAYLDPVTGIRNYNKFIFDAQCLLRNNLNKKYAVWSFDVKKFQTINNLFGVEVGDRVLKRFSLIFEEFEELEGDDIVFCRDWGDHFVGIRSYADKQDLISWFWRIINRLENERMVLSKNQIHCDFAIGFYCMDDFKKNSSMSHMINGASVAKKMAKTKPGSQFCFFSPEVDQRMSLETMLIAEGRLALTKGEITFFIQPKISIQNELLITGGEVLARWNHPIYGWIPPSQFIPLFEKNDFIIELDRYVFELACSWYAAQRESNMPPFLLAVNVSRQNLMQDDFVNYYSSVKQKYNITDELLELEITESTLLEDYQLFGNLMVELQRQGFMCSLDDFGSGYSSLNLLKKVPINILKFDATFFKDIESSREKIIMANLLNMTRDLGIKTVAEGIDQHSQVEFLKTIGFNIVQGYIFYKPLTQNDFAALLRNAGNKILVHPRNAYPAS